MMIKVDQVRRVIETIYYRPSEARERVYIFTDSAFMKEAANSLLKVLEEPPEFATIFLRSENAGELLPTIRSRSMLFQLEAVSVEEVDRYLAEHRPEWKVPQRALVARLCEGALGRARSFDLDGYIAARGRCACNSELCACWLENTRSSSRSPKPIAPAPKAETKRNSFSELFTRCCAISCSSARGRRSWFTTPTFKANS